MIFASFSHLLLALIVAISILLMLIRPRNILEVYWVGGGAILLVALRLIPLKLAGKAAAEGSDVYLFLIGMMLLSELAREHGVFDWLSSAALKGAHGSSARLFTLVYGVGTLVTVFMSNDATAVVLTPAILAAIRKAKVAPVPYLMACAMIANAASFVLPISNPANLVIYGNHMPPLLQWLPRYALPSVVSIVATYLALRWMQRHSLLQKIEADVTLPPLTGAGKTAALGIAATALILLTASALDIQLGLPTAIAGCATAGIVLIRERKSPWATLRGVSWGVLPMVAGLFVLVEALDKSGLIRMIGASLHDAAERSIVWTIWGVGVVLALACNLMNNLPTGLIGGSAVHSAQVPEQVTSAILIGVDLGPNLSVTGSLATILWLMALRREGQNVTAWTFLKLGALVMPPALLLALATLFLLH